MPSYLAEFYEPDTDDLTSETFAAADDDDAAVVALRRFPSVESVVAQENGRNELVWERHPTMYLKFIADGAATLEDVVAAVEAVAQELRDKQQAGFTLADPVDGGHIRLNRPEA